MRRIKIAALSLLGMIAVPALVLISPLQASAATVVDPLGPPMVNVLPSTVKGAVSGMSANTQMMSGLVYKMAMDPKLVQAYINMQAGTATAAEVAQATAAASKFSVLATKLGPLVKGAGAAGTAFTGYSLGASVGNGVANLIGLDPQSVICDQSRGAERDLLAFFAGQTCAPLGPQEAFVPNQGVTVVPAGFAGTNVFTNMPLGAGGTGQITAGQPTGVAYRQPAPWTMTVTQTASGQCKNDGWSPPSLGVVFYFRLPSGTMLDAIGSSSQPSGYLGYPGCQQFENVLRSVVTSDKVPYAGAYLDHITFNGNVERTDWYPPGHPLAPPGTSANPVRTLQCKVTFTDGSSAVGSGKPFTETDPLFNPPQCPDLLGKTPSKFEIIEHADGGDTDHVLSEMPTTQEYQQQVGSYPECSTGSCRLDLIKLPDTSCFVDVATCADWFTDPQKNDDYQCKYGTHAVALTECTVYAPAFKQKNLAAGSPLGDPTTGEPLPSPTKTGTDKDAFGNPIQNPDADRQCFPTGWGVFNPVEWVMKPVQCAMQWAFVPSPKHVTAVQNEMDETYRKSAFGKAAAAVSAIHFPAAPTGCSGIDLDLSGWKTQPAAAGLFGAWSGHVTLLAACDGDVLRPYAIAVNVVLTGVILFGGFKAVLAILSKVFGYSGPGAIG